MTGARADASGVGFRFPALAGVALLTFSYASVLYRVTDVVGGSRRLLALVAVSLALAAATARLVRPRTAALVAGVLLAGGLVGYLRSVPPSQRSLLLSGHVVSDTAALLTGLSVMRLTSAGVWATAVAPGPTFLSWYLAVRRRYVSSVTVGGVTLGLFVLTGDANGFTTLAGVVGGTAAVGLGTLERRGGAPAQVETLTATIAAMVVVSAVLSVGPGSAAGPLSPGPASPTVESNLVEARDQVDVRGSVRLSPSVRFTVESPEGRYWQTAAYDRYTGSGWTRTGAPQAYEGRLPSPPGDARSLRQRVTARTPLGAFPAAWRPVELRGPGAETALVTPQGGVRPEGAVATGESYTVISRVPRYTEADLREAGTDYPDRIAATYRQLPGSTPDRVHRRARDVTADAGSPYEAARAVERHLESEKRYSLTVEEPRGSVADAFLFEMESGYCVYYATTMVTMLRAEGIPSRFVVGYTAGRPTDGGDGESGVGRTRAADGVGPGSASAPAQAADREYVVRGLNAHAWVQVYFPDVGWVNFDPTPAAPRRDAERTRVREAGGSNGTRAVAGGADTGSSAPVADSGTATPGTAGPPTSPTATPARSTGTPVTGGGTGGGPGLPSFPSGRTLALWTVALAGALAVGRRTGLARRAAAAVRLRYQRRRAAPEADVARAYDRLERLLATRERPRAPGETPRAYVEALVEAGADERAVRVVDAYERARYGDGVSRAEADAVVAAVDRLTRERTPVVRRFVD